MLQSKEENRGSRVLQAYINQNVTSESHTSTIHSAVAKGRLSFGPSHHYPDSRRRVIRLRQESQQLPVLGKKVQKEQPVRRMYESLIIGDQQQNKEPPIRKVRLSELITNFTAFSRGSTKKQTETAVPQKRTAMVGTEYVPRKKKKAGYEGQKLRLQQNQNQISRFLSNYQRVQAVTKLKDVVGDLKEEVIRTHSDKFALLNNNQ